MQSNNSEIVFKVDAYIDNPNPYKEPRSIVRTVSVILSEDIIAENHRKSASNKILPVYGKVFAKEIVESRFAQRGFKCVTETARDSASEAFTISLLDPSSVVDGLSLPVGLTLFDS